MQIKKEGFDCCHCENTIEPNKLGLVISNNEIMCEECACNTECCYDCEERHESDDMYEINDEWYCDVCIWEHYIICDSCEDYVGIDYYHYDEDNDERLCNDCKPERFIKNYSFKPEPIFFFQQDKEKPYFEKDKRIVFGFELEVENYSGAYSSEDLARELKAQFDDFLYFKWDSSLEDGFEIVSHPMTYCYFKSNINRFKSMLQTIRNCGFRSYDMDTCGLHITLSRKTFTHSHFLKFVDFFNNSSNHALLKALSQRTSRSSHWAKLKKDFNKRTMIEFAKDKNSHQPTDRHKALNLTNTKTIEIRLFRGTLKDESFLKAFESVLSIYDYTYKMTFNALKINEPKLDKQSKNVRDEILKNANLDGFVAPITKGLINKNYYITYIASHKKQFSNLDNFLKNIPQSNYKIHGSKNRIFEFNKLINNERMYI